MAEDRGTYIRYVDKRFGADAMERLRIINIVIHEYESKGYSLTLRQLYYQLVARGLLDNLPREYDRLGDLVSDGRLAGLISWTAIEDRGRNLMGLRTSESPGAAVGSLVAEYRSDLWANQPWRPEVWPEKQALEGVVGDICERLRVDFFATKGYNSQSEAWRAGRRMAGYIAKGQRPIVFHLGDHDPSGIDMTRDNRERLSMFAGTPITVVRLALNMSQVEEYNPPPNPAKLTDSRAAEYVAEHGYSSWELDALPPNVIHDLIERAVLKLRDKEAWDKALAAEAEERDVIRQTAEELGWEPPEKDHQ